MLHASHASNFDILFFLPLHTFLKNTYGFKLHSDKFTISILSWLILYVNLTGIRDAQIAGKTLFLGLSVRIFLAEISI